MINVHKIHSELNKKNGPSTTGITIRWAPQYDILTRLMGLGVDTSSSRMTIKLAGVKSGDKVLDVGCGTGSLTMTAKIYAGATGLVYGIDASPVMVEVARKKTAKARLGVTFDVGLIEKIPYPDNTFDVVVSRLTIHHLPGDLKRKGFKEIFRVLKPGGYLLISEFNPPTNPILNHIFSAMFGPRMMQFTVGTILPLFSDAGFIEVTEPVYTNFLAHVGAKKPKS